MNQLNGRIFISFMASLQQTDGNKLLHLNLVCKLYVYDNVATTVDNDRYYLLLLHVFEHSLRL